MKSNDFIGNGNHNHPARSIVPLLNIPHSSSATIDNPQTCSNSKNGVFCLALVITDVSEELNASFIRVAKIDELGTTIAVTSNRRTLRRNTKSVLTRATRRNIPEDAILHNSNLYSYILN
jgi:hypothetical protein